MNSISKEIEFRFGFCFVMGFCLFAAIAVIAIA